MNWSSFVRPEVGHGRRRKKGIRHAIWWLGFLCVRTGWPIWILSVNAANFWWSAALRALMLLSRPVHTHVHVHPGWRERSKKGGGEGGRKKVRGEGGRRPAMDSAFSTRSMWGAACNGLLLLLLSQLCPCPLWSKIIKAQGRTALKNCFSCTTGCTTKVVISDTKVYFQFAGQNCSL